MIAKTLPYQPGKGQVDTHTGPIPAGDVYVGQLVIPDDVREQGAGILIHARNNTNKDWPNGSLSRTPGSFTRADNLRGAVNQSCEWHGGRGLLGAGVWYVNLEGPVDDMTIGVRAQQPKHPGRP